MYLDLYAALPESVARECGVSWSEDGGTLRLTLRAADHPFFNRVMGVGATGPGLEPWLDRILEHYREAGVTRWMLQVAPANAEPGLIPALTERDLVPLRGWAKHAGRVGDVSIEERASDLRVESIGPESAEPWASILLPAFAFPAGSAAWPVATVGRPGWRHYVAWDGDEAAACAAMFVTAGVATLTFAATRPEYRRRGAQSRLIARRVRDAHRMGLDWIVTETDEDLPEKPNPSYRNVVRAGMPVHYIRANWGPSPPPSSNPSAV